MRLIARKYGILIHYNEQNLEIVERMRAGNGKQVIILEWPKSPLPSCTDS